MAAATATARFRTLLRKGYFPAELPPPFTTAEFAKHAVAIRQAWANQSIKSFWTSPEQYSVPKFARTRRKLAIVNPVSQLLVADLVAENWDDIEKRLQRATITEFKPRISMLAERAVPGVNFDAVSRRRVKILARYGRYVKTDITRFYSSVYTHSIAWALLGKDAAKANMNTPAFRASFPNRLDEAVRAGQAGQSIGLPIGPDTSRILAELIATEIEVILSTRVSDLKRRGVRYVDDMLLGVSDEQSPETVIADLTSAMDDFGLELSAEKTSVVGIGQTTPPEWVHYIRGFNISQTTAQRDDIDSYFEQAVHLSELHPREGVLVFAVKRAAGLKVYARNLRHLIRWMMYCCRRSGACYQTFVEFVVARKTAGDISSLAGLARFIEEEIAKNAASRCTAEVAWLLFLARELKLQIDVASLEAVVSHLSGVWALLVMDLRQRSLLSGSIDESTWRAQATKEGLRGEFWLGAYEITKKAWWRKTKSSKYIEDHEYFGSVFAKDVYFYDEKRGARRIGRSPLAIPIPFSQRASWGGYP